MTTSNAAGRYAEALLESLGQASADDKQGAQNELEKLSEALGQVSELNNVLAHPGYSTVERENVLNAVMSHLSISDRVQRLIRLAVSRGRGAEIPLIAEKFKSLLNQQSGLLQAQVTASIPLDADKLEALKAALETKVGKRIEIDFRVDPDLIGGIRTQIGSVVYDGSIKAGLDKLSSNLYS